MPVFKSLKITAGILNLFIYWEMKVFTGSFSKAAILCAGDCPRLDLISMYSLSTLGMDLSIFSINTLPIYPVAPVIKILFPLYHS